MEQNELTLRKGVTLSVLNGEIGVMLEGSARFARCAQEQLLLRALREREQTPEELKTLLRASGVSTGETEAALALAGFILDFGDYLEG